MKDPERKMLVDPTWIRIALFPKMHAVGYGSSIPEERRLPGSIYDWEYREMFTVLRVTTSGKKPYLPRVIDIL